MSTSTIQNKKSQPKHRELVRAAGVMGILTAMSRILGFFRDGLIAAFYGTSPTAQAFIVAFRIPNLLRDMVGEGASNTAFVPVFSRVRAREGEESWALLAQAIWTRILLVFLFICVIGTVGAPWLVNLVAPGFHGDPELMGLTTRLTRIMFPFIGLVGISAFFMGLLNSVNHFTLPSLGPVLLNISMIGGLFLLKRDALGLAYGVLFGGVLQLAVQWPVVLRTGVHLGFSFKRKSHPGVHQINRLLVPRMVGTGVYQLSVLVDTIFASFRQLVGSGGIAALYFANRFLHLPLALFGISMAQAVLPTMSAQAAQDDLEALTKTSIMALRSSLLIAVPSSLGLIVLGHPIVRTLLERGAFSEESTRLTVTTLQFYAIGLISLCATKVLANTFYALHDTWTPVRSAAMALAANVALNALLIVPMQLPGLALATSISSTWNSLHLYRLLCRRLGSFDQELKEWFVRVCAASLLMGIVACGMWWAGMQFIHSTRLTFLWLFWTIACAALSFILFGVFLRIDEIRGSARWFLQKIRFRKN